MALINSIKSQIIRSNEFSKLRFVIYEKEILQAEKLRLILLADVGADSSLIQIIRDWSLIEILSKTNTIDVIFLGLNFNEIASDEIVIRAAALSPSTAVIVLSDSDDDQVAHNAIQNGAQDVFVRGFLSGKALQRMIAYAVERRRLWSSLEQLNLKLREIGEQKNRFLGMAAHDLRGPIGNILGFMSILLEETNNTISKEDQILVERVTNISQSLLRLVDDLLDVSKIESGAITLVRSNVNLAKLIENCVFLQQRLADKKKIHIVCILNPNVELFIDGDRISQVIDNLLSNAIKYSMLGGTIYVRLNVLDDCVEVEVEDNGQGISQEALHKLFQPFQTAGSIATGSEKSTGLGLAIVRKIISEHGGSVSVKSEKNVGSTFWFKLPK